MSRYRDALDRVFREQKFEPELSMAAGKVARANLPDETNLEALKRIRSKTGSLRLQDILTREIGDAWVAVVGNSEVQPYTRK